MNATPDTETIESKVQNTEPSCLSGCTGRGCVISLVCLLLFILVMIPIIKNARERARADYFAGGIRDFYFCLSESNYKQGHLPPPFRYPDLAGEEDGQVYLDEFVEKYDGPQEKIAWFKPGEPYLGHRVAKEPDTNAEPLLSWRITMAGMKIELFFGYFNCNNEWTPLGEEWEIKDDEKEAYGINYPYPRFWESWNSEANSFVRDDLSAGTHVCGPEPGSNQAHMIAIVGPDTAFGDGKSTPMKLGECQSNMILIVESRNSGIHWMEPRDFDIRTMPRTINAPDGSGIAGNFKHGFHVIFADGEVWRIKHTVPFEELEKFFTLESAKRYDREEVLGPYVDKKFGAGNH